MFFILNRQQREGVLKKCLVPIALLFTTGCAHYFYDRTTSRSVDESRKKSLPVAHTFRKESPWTTEQIETYCRKYNIHDLPDSLHFHFPRQSFLRYGYHPPGGYVKDFSLLDYDGRWHLFHIDGRPGEICWVTGNEISFGHASTDDFQHWIRHRMPLAICDRSWENQHIWAPYVYKDTQKFYMFYMANGTDGTYITYATSDDLEHWERRAEGPLHKARGRDPFVFKHEGQTILVYTSNSKQGNTKRLGACTTTDMKNWRNLPAVLKNPHGSPESASIHPHVDHYVLWFNDWGEQGNFRAAYVLSEDPLHFEAKNVRSFRFIAGPDEVPPDHRFRKPHRLTKPVATSIELVGTGDKTWLVAYFRVVGNGFRLFFGEMDWRTEPVTIREISDPEHLRKVLERTKAQRERQHAIHEIQAKDANRDL
jgi:predicted GH43/DUF377 family glycosyl hydrolase